MRVAVFGCSWTCGVPVEWSKKTTNSKYKKNIPQEDFVNWTRELGKLDTNLEIYNYALPGTSIEFSLCMLERYLKNPDCDLAIFQATRPYRYTYWHQNFNEKDCLINREPNVYQFDSTILEYVNIVNHHDGGHEIWNLLSKSGTQTENKYIKNYFRRTNHEMFENSYKAILNYVKDEVDICFSHESNGLTNSVQDTLGDKIFENYWMDVGKHFGIEGAQWQAKWVLDQINTHRG